MKLIISKAIYIYFTVLLIVIVNVICKKSKYTINYNSVIDTCNDVTNNFMDVSKLRATRINDTMAVLDGPLITKKAIRSPFTLAVTVYKVLPIIGTMELIGTYEVYDVCEGFRDRHQDTAAGRMLRTINMSDECPIVAGNYYIDNMSADKIEIPKNALMEGKFSVKLEYYSVPEGSPFSKMPIATQKEACLRYEISVDKDT